MCYQDEVLGVMLGCESNCLQTDQSLPLAFLVLCFPLHFTSHILICLLPSASFISCIAVAFWYFVSTTDNLGRTNHTTDFSIAWKTALSRENSTERMLKIFWLLTRGKLQGCSLLNIFFLAVSCNTKADVLFLVMPCYSAIRSIAAVGLDPFWWGFVRGAAQWVLDFISTITLVV